MEIGRERVCHSNRRNFFIFDYVFASPKIHEISRSSIRLPTISTPVHSSTSIAASLRQMTIEQDQRIAEVVKREQSRLRNFIRRRVADPRDVEDILQDVFYKLVEANRLLMPIDHITGWLFRVARNRII